MTDDELSLSRPFVAPDYRTVLSIGSNLGDSDDLVAWVVACARETGGRVEVSGIYRTPPWGGVEQPDFRNVTIAIESAYTPRQWLLWGNNLEARALRTRELRWGPRTLDVDVIAADLIDDRGDRLIVRSDDPQLLLPHPRAFERAFVLVPWLEIEPDAQLDGVPISELIQRLPEAERAAIVRLGDVPPADPDDPPVVRE
ncbi:2-amino-4-hydroxy-6-hydroxymethyldihydropteridine diphosphokinase [Dietzia sp.]|uniref:2-amino-4-hydroxy-6- hydroxymethyldihydropteridine diphosphokinase n=1 Tax=Dietzia sp. TaxID=1871616 RepID=UPI002FDB86F1